MFVAVVVHIQTLMSSPFMKRLKNNRGDSSLPYKYIRVFSVTWKPHLQPTAHLVLCRVVYVPPDRSQNHHTHFLAGGCFWILYTYTYTSAMQVAVSAASPDGAVEPHQVSLLQFSHNLPSYCNERSHFMISLLFMLLWGWSVGWWNKRSTGNLNSCQKSTSWCSVHSLMGSSVVHQSKHRNGWSQSLMFIL